MLEFLVKLGWRAEFLFDSLDEAARFARTAFRTRTGDEVGDEVEIIIREVKIKNKEEEDDETDNV